MGYLTKAVVFIFVYLLAEAVFYLLFPSISVFIGDIIGFVLASVVVHFLRL
ncbi:Uncharacterised protein [uncultured archaeon]|nr:Uncharacterised protein [uncultured archaeon]